MGIGDVLCPQAPCRDSLRRKDTQWELATFRYLFQRYDFFLVDEIPNGNWRLGVVALNYNGSSGRRDTQWELATYTVHCLCIFQYLSCRRDTQWELATIFNCFAFCEIKRGSARYPMGIGDHDAQGYFLFASLYVGEIPNGNGNVGSKT